MYLARSNFHMPGQYMNKSCKGDIYCWENKHAHRSKNYLPSRIRNHKILHALGQNRHTLGIQPWSINNQTGKSYCAHFNGLLSVSPRLGLTSPTVTIFWSISICSLVKIWEDPPQIATKTKWPPSCREFLCRFQKWKVYQNQPSGTFSNFILYIRTLRKTIEKKNNLFFFTIMKNVSLFTINMVYIYFRTQYTIMWMAGWLITEQFKG